MITYLDLLQTILNQGTRKPNRTGVDTISIHGYMLRHDLRTGFPLLTTKKMSLKNIAVELEFFIKGYRNKQWLIDHGCTIWNEWGNPKKVLKALLQKEITPSSENYNSHRLLQQKEEMDLGPVYGYLWNNWVGVSDEGEIIKVNQLEELIHKLKTDPFDRRMIVTAWQPALLSEMALPSCHFIWQVFSDGQHIDLLFNMRSVDVALGLPYNLASYSLLLILLGMESNLIPRHIIASLGETHIYLNHIDGCREQLTREPFTLPTIEIKNFTSIFKWEHTDFDLLNYKFHDKIKFEVAV